MRGCIIFQRDRAPQPAIDGLVDRAHASLGQEPHDLESLRTIDLAARLDLPGNLARGLRVEGTHLVP
jgi:hypothetical protein